MTANPYDPPSKTESSGTRLRSVGGLVLWAVFFAFCAHTPISSGLQLLNQELGVFPVPYGVFDIEIGGVPVSNNGFMISTLLSGILLLSIALVLALRARRNYRYNQALRDTVPSQTGG